MDRYLNIKKGNTELMVDKIGAQIVSMKVNGIEVMFQGALDPENSQWQGTAKNLFPNPGPVGKTSDKYGELKQVAFERNGKIEKHTEYYHNGGVYHMGQHGFAQSLDYDVQSQQSDTLVLSISADDQTVKEYPYDFKYTVAYQIDGEGGLDYTSIATNKDTKPMLAGMGWHPAFKLHDHKSKYKLVFKNLKKEEGCEIQEDVFYDIDELIDSGKSVRFEGIKSVDVFIIYEQFGKYVPYVNMHSEEPILILWSRPRDSENANQKEDFICIEPWNQTPRQIQKLTTQDKTKTIDGAVIIEPKTESVLNANVCVNTEYAKIIASQFSQTKESEEVDNLR